MAQIRIGIARWTPSTQLLGQYSHRFNTVEVNLAAFVTPSVSSLYQWHLSTPPDFKFSLKANRYLALTLQLKNPRMGLLSFEKSVTGLRDKLGILLFQIPATIGPDSSLLRSFLQALPKKKLRYAFQFLNPNWHRAETLR